MGPSEPDGPLSDNTQSVVRPVGRGSDGRGGTPTPDCVIPYHNGSLQIIAPENRPSAQSPTGALAVASVRPANDMPMQTSLGLLGAVLVAVWAVVFVGLVERTRGDLLGEAMSVDEAADRPG